MKDCYIEFDGVGLKAIYCMDCLNEVLSSRDILEINGKTAVIQKRNSSYNQKFINAFNNGKPTTFNVILCNECIKKELNVGNLIQQIRLGIVESLKYNGQTPEDISKILETGYNLTTEGE